MNFQTFDKTPEDIRRASEQRLIGWLVYTVHKGYITKTAQAEMTCRELERRGVVKDGKRIFKMWEG